MTAAEFIPLPDAARAIGCTPDTLVAAVQRKGAFDPNGTAGHKPGTAISGRCVDLPDLDRVGLRRARDRGDALGFEHQRAHVGSDVWPLQRIASHCCRNHPGGGSGSSAFRSGSGSGTAWRGVPAQANRPNRQANSSSGERGFIGGDLSGAGSAERPRGCLGGDCGRQAHFDARQRERVPAPTGDRDPCDGRQDHQHRRSDAVGGQARRHELPSAFPSSCGGSGGAAFEASDVSV